MIRESKPTLTSAQYQEFMQLINTQQDDAAFQYLKSKTHDPSKRRKRRSKYQEE